MAGVGPDSTCKRCHRKHLTCERISTRYRSIFARKLASLRAASKSSRALHTRRSSSDPRQSRAANNAVDGPSRLSPPIGEHWHTAWDSKCDAPGPAYELLVGGTGYFAGLESAKAALFWRSELEDTEAMIDSAFRQRKFYWKMLNEALARCMVPPPDEHSRAKRVKFTRRDSTDKGSGDADIVGEGNSRAKGKGRVDGMDLDEEEASLSSSDSGSEGEH